eukprot:TRINITY_DN17123_c0_g1_i3.p3 TRINITY_DN17123_c0_g1~~TRINITY_DN17123_c0_g1_i3.p3  ORF type:complete len:213 (-),score=103.06 TRINITY_DN17123_c0_g1_i3:734-1372(-)
MVKHNNVVPNVHFHKEWDRRVKTWFDQAGQKKRRSIQRLKKLRKAFPRPLGSLRPSVHINHINYNHRTKLGRGFTLEELKVAGINRQYARSVGIAVDHRRRNHSEESLQANVQRLKEYQSKLVVFPRDPKKPKKGDASADELSKVTQIRGDVMPLKVTKKAVETVKIADLDVKTGVYEALRRARADARLVGIRQKKAQKKEADAAAAAQGGN